MGLGGLSQINLELTAMCDRHTLCGFCGHQNDKINPGAKGEMSFALLCKLRDQLPRGVVVQLHRDGEPTHYSRLGDALLVLSGFIVSIVTHGENLAHKANEIIDNCTTVTVSVFKGDPDAELQYESVKEFLHLKGDQKPQVNIKIVGDMTPEMEDKYGCLGVPIIRRLLHVPDGNYRYAGGHPTIPEHNICVDFLSHPSIDWRGNLYICNRLDPSNQGLLGDLNTTRLDVLWNSPQRMEWLEAHKRGRRDQASPLCHKCIFWGVASG